MRIVDSSVAALAGAAIGSLAGLAGPLISGSIQSSRDRSRWLLDNRKAAYVDTIQHLSTGLNMRSRFSAQSGFLVSEDDIKSLFEELSASQASLAALLILCSDGQRVTLAAILAEVTTFIEAMKRNTRPPGTLDIAVLHQKLVESARSDLHIG